MKYYKKIMDCVDHKHITDEMWEEVAEDTNDFLEDIKVSHPDKVHHFLKKIEDVLLFPPFTEQKANEIVSKFVNKDGTRGAHWSFSQVRDVAKTHPEVQKFDFLDFYVALNMIYSDYYCSKFNTEDYIQLTIDFMGDTDAPKNKVRRYIKAMEI
jgi:hypothetical protein